MNRNKIRERRKKNQKWNKGNVFVLKKNEQKDSKKPTTNRQHFKWHQQLLD